MLDRFTAASKQISWAGLGQLLQTGPVGMLLLGLAWLGATHFGRPLLQSIDPVSLGGGRMLSELLVAEDLSAVAHCRDDACTFETDSPAAAPPSDVPVRWIAEPIRRLPWPARPAYPSSFMAAQTSEWVAEARDTRPDAPEHSWRLTIGSNEGGLHHANLEVASGGYVARLLFRDDSGIAPLTVQAHGADQPRRQAVYAAQGEALRRWRQAGNGRGRDGHIDYAALPTDGSFPSDPLAVTGSPEGLEFQPMPTPIRVQVPAEWAGRVKAGDPAILRFEAPAGFSPPVEVPGKVTATRGEVAMVEPDERTDRWLQRYFREAAGRAPGSDRLTLRVRESLGGRAGDSVQVPAGAVVQRPGEAGAIVWVIAAGLAAPIRVGVGATDGDRVTVNELVSPLSGPVDPAGWRAMTPEQRARLHRLQAPHPVGSTPLLDLRSEVVVHPGAALRPGDPVRRR
jgi:hypothetical protein